MASSFTFDPARLRAAEATINTHARRGLIRAAEAILEDSQRRVPYRTRELMESGAVVPVSDLDVAVTYTDSKAVAAHENMDDRYGHGREAKFLENAINEKRQVAATLIAQEIKKAFD